MNADPERANDNMQPARVSTKGSQGGRSPCEIPSLEIVAGRRADENKRRPEWGALSVLF